MYVFKTNTTNNNEEKNTQVGLFNWESFKIGFEGSSKIILAKELCVGYFFNSTQARRRHICVTVHLKNISFINHILEELIKIVDFRTQTNVI